MGSKGDAAHAAHVAPTEGGPIRSVDSDPHRRGYRQPGLLAGAKQEHLHPEEASRGAAAEPTSPCRRPRRHPPPGQPAPSSARPARPLPAGLRAPSAVRRAAVVGPISAARWDAQGAPCERRARCDRLRTTSGVSGCVASAWQVPPRGSNRFRRTASFPRGNCTVPGHRGRCCSRRRSRAGRSRSPRCPGPLPPSRSRR